MYFFNSQRTSDCKGEFIQEVWQASSLVDACQPYSRCRPLSLGDQLMLTKPAVSKGFPARAADRQETDQREIWRRRQGLLQWISFTTEDREF